MSGYNKNNNNNSKFRLHWPKDLLAGMSENFNTKEAGHYFLSLPHKIFKLFRHRRINGEMEDLKL